MPAITAYTDIISFERAKTYLRIDEDVANIDEQEIESMIKAAFLFIERYTCHLFGARDLSGTKPIYNYPINSISGEPTEPDWSKYYQRNMDKLCYEPTDTVYEYNAGYVNVEDVPDDFIQAALQMIKVWYFESEKQVNSTLIPISVTQVLDTYRRFV